MASDSQKLARKRRKERQRSLMEAGKKAVDTVGVDGRQANEAAERAARLEAEAAETRSALGVATSDLAAVRQALEVKTTLLGGLEDELKQASGMVDEMKAEVEASKSNLARKSRELDEARAADSDARSLRNRLKAKSDEIIKLADQIRRLKGFLDHHNLLKAYFNLYQGAEEAAAMVAKEEASPVVPSALTAGPEAATAEPAVG